ncbi:MAG TPA: zinc-ribbon domain-containing protein [Dermatophilaceae bacterium]
MRPDRACRSARDDLQAALEAAMGTPSAGTGNYAWWKCDRGPDHEWQAQVRSRTIRGTTCPFCAHRKVARSDSVAVTHPDVAATWHPTRIGAKTPAD